MNIGSKVMHIDLHAKGRIVARRRHNRTTWDFLVRWDHNGRTSLHYEFALIEVITCK